MFSRYEIHRQCTVLDELYSFTQKAGEVAITLRVRLEAINERVQAEGAYFGEDKLVHHFLQRLQQPFQDKLIPYPRTLDEAVEKLTVLEEAAAKISAMDRRSGVTTFAVITEGARANVPRNTNNWPTIKINKHSILLTMR